MTVRRQGVVTTLIRQKQIVGVSTVIRKRHSGIRNQPFCLLPQAIASNVDALMGSSLLSEILSNSRRDSFFKDASSNRLSQDNVTSAQALPLRRTLVIFALIGIAASLATTAIGHSIGAQTIARARVGF